MLVLPDEYIDYFVGDGPKEGGLLVEPGWFQLWHPSQIQNMNESYRVKEYAPGFLGFGSSGGGEMLAFDMAHRIHMVPFIGMAPEEARLVADSWADFVAKMEA